MSASLTSPQPQPPPRYLAGRVSQESNGGSGGGGAPNNEELVEEGKVLCREYIDHRLLRCGTLSQHQLDSLTYSVASSETSEELQLVGEELEAMYPDLFKNVHRQLNLTMHSEEVVRRTFTMFAEQLCSGGIHWGKIAALYAMAGAFAVDCASQGHLEFTQTIPNAFAAFAATRLCGWLGQQGGWNLAAVTRSNKASEDQTGAWIAGSLAVLAVLVVAVLLG